MTQLQQYLTGEEAKLAAFEKVLEASEGWQAKAEVVMANLHGWEGTGEDLREIITAAIGRPEHFNAWGALIAIGVRRKQLIPTGEHRHMQRVTSHARSNPVYRSRHGWCN